MLVFGKGSLVRVAVAVACVGASCLAGHAVGTPGGTTDATTEGLDYAFRFATAIYNDDRDRSKAQQAVIGDYIELEAFDEAAQRASSVEGWRRAVALADLGRALAEAGRIDEARKTVARAQQLRRQVNDFRGPRIDHHIAQAIAGLGEVERSRAINESTAAADRLQYLGRSIAVTATTYARDGRFDEAMDYLNTVDVDEWGIDDLAWWRTQGYLELAGMTRLDHEQRLSAANAAGNSLEAVSGSARYGDGLLGLARAYKALGAAEETEKSLDAAESLVDRIPDNFPTKPNDLTALARVWAEMDECERAQELLKQAESLVPLSQPIEQPAMFAWVACSYLLLDEADHALRVYERALAVAETLVNPRPRALAFVAIGRSMGLHGMNIPDAFRSRLDAALAGLKPPAAAGSS